MYPVYQIGLLRNSTLCMYCLDGVPLENGLHDLFGVEKVPCNEQHLTTTEADSPMAPVCGRCGQRKCTCQHGPYPIIGERA